MKRFLILSSILAFSISAFSQNTIKIETMIDSIDWENCTETDLALMYNDNLIIKNKSDEEWRYQEDIKFVIRNIQIGKYIFPVAIPHYYNYSKQLKALHLIFESETGILKDLTFEQFEEYIVNYIKNIFGKKYRKVEEYGYWKDAHYYWEHDYHIGCGVEIWVTGKDIVVSLEKDLRYSDYFKD